MSERANNDASIAEVLSMMRSISGDLANNSKLTLAVQADMADMRRSLHEILRAFPDGPEAHRLCHIEKAENKKNAAQFKRHIVLAVITLAVLTGAGFIASATVEKAIREARLTANDSAQSQRPAAK